LAGLTSWTTIANISDTRFPTIYFKSNSLTTVPSFNYEEYEISMKCFSNIALIPPMYLTITGHSDTKESKAKELAFKRATYIKNEILKLDLQKYGGEIVVDMEDKPLYSDSLILAQKSKVVADSLRQMNRCVTFSMKVKK
jgi:hypothetical protein